MIGIASRSELSRDGLQRMADAGVTVVDCMHQLNELGSSVVLEILKNGPEFAEEEHYPPDDVRDPATGAQYYFHAHSSDGRDQPDFGHFHTFIRVAQNGRSAMDAVGPAGAGSSVSHVVAISMTPEGMPERLFTTNRWVTDETWRDANDVTAALDSFSTNIEEPSRILNLWITSMFRLFRPQIEHLLLERDRVIDCWRRLHPSSCAFEDRRLSVPSSVPISLRLQLEWLDRELGE